MRNLSLAVVVSLVTGCSPSMPLDPDAGPHDAGVTPLDSGVPDAGEQTLDSGLPPEDAGTDAGSDVDAGVDAGIDAGLPSGPPVTQGPPNVPEFSPAFPGQTRAPAIVSQTMIQVTEITSGLRNPWGLAFLPDQRMLVTEKPTGNMFIITPAGAKSPAITGLPAVDGRGQGGLLDVEVGPDYATTQLIYWTYAEPRTGGNGLAVARGRLIDVAQPRVENVQVLFRMMPTLESTLHFGGRLLFAADGKLFVTMGERSILAGRVQAQDMTSHFGKIIRINADGTVPTDNPFVNTPGAQPEIWSYGHRNVQAAAFDDQQRLWIGEMGPRGGDELNLIAGGANYGWPTIGYGEEYSGAAIHQSPVAAGMEQPVYYWDPVIAPSGMTVYTGMLFPEWRNNVFLGGLAGQSLVRLRLHNDRVVGEEWLLRGANRVREVVQGPEGALYLLTDATNGKLLKITPQ